MSTLTDEKEYERTVQVLSVNVMQDLNPSTAKLFYSGNITKCAEMKRKVLRSG